MDRGLSSALMQFLQKATDGDISLSVSFTDSAEVLELKTRIAQLESQIEGLERRANSAELQHGNITVRYLRLIDYCRENGFHVPKKLK